MTYDIEPHKSWFNSFAACFLECASEEADKRNIRIKIEHTLRVFQRITQIADSLPVTETMRDLARIVALYHDVGRFPQYMYFRTFDDRKSFNHALLSLDVLRGKKTLHALLPEHRRLALGAIWLHNRLSIPSSLPPELSFLARILRDADKLDILFVILSHLNSDPEASDAVTWNLKHHPTAYSEGVLKNVQSGKQVQYGKMEWINDAKLMLCSWIYDMNFPASKQIWKEEGYLDGLLALLPNLPEIAALGEQLRWAVTEDPSRGDDH